MRLKLFVLALIPFLMSCAAFKQLKPEPEVEGKEGAFIQLKDDDDHFELDKGNQYYIEFPAPPEDNFYLLVTVSDRDNIAAGLADKFDDDKGPLSRVLNEASTEAAESAYPVKRTVKKYYWVVERVDKDLVLEMQYRYLPQWRYKFETQYESFENILAENRVDRTIYQNIGGSVSLRNFSFTKHIGELDVKSDNLEGLFLQLASIEKLFPPSILNSSDEAYRNYLTLKEDIDLEITFQKNYKSALKLFEKEMSTRDAMPAFVQAIPDFLSFYENKARYPENIISTVNRTFDARLDELTPYYDDLVKSKNDFEPVDLNVADVDALYAAIGSKPSSTYKALAAYVSDYNKKSTSMSEVRSAMDGSRNKISGLNKWPDNNFFKNLSAQIKQLGKDLPAAGFSSHGAYANTKGAKLLNNAIHSLRSQSIRLAEDYNKTQAIVSQLNRYAASKSYGQMIDLINRNKQLSFLSGLYKDLDAKSLTQQKATITSAMTQQNWHKAEDALRGLHVGNSFLNLRSIKANKTKTVKALEDTLLARVERVTRQKVNEFVNKRFNEVNDVDGLYKDPVFQPAWNITFTSGSQRELAARKQKLNERLKNLKEIEFPAKAIQFLYNDFIGNVNNNGVLKARAIVTHGKYYKGDKFKIRNLVAECDPWAAKWITKEATYRKILAIPTTTNPTGENTYVFRVNFRIPNDARFPAYEVKIKLPKEVASDAGSAAWYEQMTMNKELLKPEGRFTITAPEGSNDYTAMLSPLQVVKDGDSVLEVRFKQNDYKVFEVSLLAQKPILRKN